MADIKHQPSGHNTDTEICQPCNYDGSREVVYGYCTNCAEYLCKACFNYHRKHKLARDHKLLEQREMQKEMKCSSTTNGTDLTDKQAVLCSSDEVSDNKVLSNEHIERYEKMLKMKEFLTKYCQKIFQAVDQKSIESEQMCEQAINLITNTGNEIKRKVDQVTEKSVIDFKELEKENKEQLERRHAKCQEISTDLKIMRGKAKQTEKLKQDNDVLLEVLHNEEQLKQYQSSLKQLGEERISKNYQYERSDIVKSFLQADSFCDINVSRASGLQISSLPTKDKIITLPKNNTNSQISGMILLTTVNMVAIDKKNNKVILINTKNLGVRCEVSTDSAPGGVARISVTKFAITLPDKQQIRNYLVTRTNQIVKLQQESIGVDGRCAGIGYKNEKFVLTFHFPNKIEILSKTGAILTRISRGPHHLLVGVDSKSIYISDSNNIIILDWQGKKIEKISKLPKLAGFVVSEDGHIYTYSSKEKHIGKVHIENKESEIVMRTNSDPCAICLCEERNILYIGENVTFQPEQTGTYLQAIQLGK